MISGRPDIFPTAAMSLRSTETSSEALQLCQKQRREACAVCHKHPHEAFAVCHKHPQAARACQKRPVLAKGHLLSQSSILCASCRCRAYASACMCAAQQGTRHNAWAWQFISPAMRPKLLNSSFLYVRGVLNQVLSQFLPHGKHVLACLCTDLRAIVAEQPVSTPCLCASQTCSIDRRPQPGVSYRTSAQGATASVCKSKGGRKRPVVKLRRLCRGRNCRKTWQFLTAVGECVKGASPRTVKAWVRRQSVPSAVRVVPLGWGRCADGTCEARYVRMQKLSCPLRARWQAARRIGQNRARKRVARRGRRQRSGSFRVRTGRAYHSAAVRGARFARGRGRQWIHCQQRQCCTPRGKIKNARDAQASGRMLSACQDKSEHGMAPAGRRPCAERPSSRTQWLRDQGDSLDSKANIRRPKAQDARAAIGAKSNDTGGACDCGRKIACTCVAALPARRAAPEVRPPRAVSSATACAQNSMT